MKVVCVNHDLHDPKERPYGPEDPQVGDICEVERAFDFHTIRGLFPCYYLIGYDQSVYNQKNFAEVTDLDETALVTQEFEEKYCVPVNAEVCV
jgi:hypothetical protein